VQLRGFSLLNPRPQGISYRAGATSAFPARCTRAEAPPLHRHRRCPLRCTPASRSKIKKNQAFPLV